MSSRRKDPKRESLIESLKLAGRKSSSAAVLFQQAVGDRFGLSATDMKTMDILWQRGPLTAGEIALATGLAQTSVTSLIDRLEEKGFARRVRDDNDRRKVIVQVDPGAGPKVEPLYQLISDAGAELAGRYSSAELELIVDYLGRSSEMMVDLVAKVAKVPHPHEAPTKTPPKAKKVGG